MQLSTVAVGVIFTTPQEYAGKFIIAVGGFFTLIVLLFLNVPQALVTCCVIIYVPGLVKLKDGFSEILLVPFVKVNAPEVPQNSGV